MTTDAVAPGGEQPSATPTLMPDEAVFAAQEEQRRAEEQAERQPQDGAPEAGETDGGDAAAEPADGEGQKPRHRGGFQKRIDELTRARSDAERDRDYWREMAMRGQQPRQDRPAPQPAVPEADPRPTPAQFQDPDAYTEALADWRARQTVAESIGRLRQEAQQQAVAQHVEQTVAAYRTRAASFAAENPDYFAVAHGSHVPLTQTMADAIVSSEQGPAVAYFLGQHREEAGRIAALPPVAQVREIGRIEAALSAPPQRTVTSAPAPIVPVGGRAAPPSRDPNRMTFEEYAEWRAKGGGR